MLVITKPFLINHYLLFNMCDLFVSSYQCSVTFAVPCPVLPYMEYPSFVIIVFYSLNAFLSNKTPSPINTLRKENSYNKRQPSHSTQGYFYKYCKKEQSCA